MSLSKVHSPYGAPMGRSDLAASDSKATMKFHLQRIYVNSQGYDAVGAYWGVGQPLWHAWAENDGSLVGEQWFRASDRDAAKAKVMAAYPNAKFYR